MPIRIPEKALVGCRGKAKTAKTSSNTFWRERWQWKSVYPGEVVREGWRKFGARRKSTRVTLAIRNILSAKVFGVHCQMGSTVKGKGEGSTLVFKIREVKVSRD